MKNKVFKTQKEHVRYLRWRRRITRIIAFLTAILVFLYILIANPRSLAAWLVFAVYVLFAVILDYLAKQEFLKQDKETAKKVAQARLADENRKKINMRK